jgi:GAF domain-containing protein
MIEQAIINKNLSDADIYASLLPQMESIISGDDLVISVLSNITAILKDAFYKISWVGFYLQKEDILYLGPFQGKAACTSIQPGKGVCGAAAAGKKTIIVDDVNSFQGHITCDSGSRSEIAVPIISGETVYGVLDLDSYSYSAFNETDKMFLEKIAGIITRKIDLDKIKNIII